MRLKLCILLFLAGSIVFRLYAQDFSNYTPLVSSGKIPKDFITLSSEVFKAEAENISKEDKRREKKTKKKFYLQSSFVLRELLFSGKVLFNDPVSIYLNKVADKLLAHDAELRNAIRIYAVKSPSVNAFATNSGMIFINLGLISQLETEAQLAFVLSHEIVHYKKGHVLENYIESERISRNKGVYRKLDIEEKLLAKNNYSKEKESEADLEGLELFLKSPYGTSSLDGVFDVLKYSYLPFDDIPFKKTFFEDSYLVFPSEYFLEETAPIQEPEEGDESKSTHPNTSTRRTYINNRLAKFGTRDQNDFLVSQQEFYTARKIARFEIANLYLHSLQYEKAIYQAYLLLQSDPDNKYCQKIIAKSLYALSKYTNEGQSYEVLTSYNDIEGSSQQVYYFFDKIKNDELNILALKYIWNAKNQFPEDQELSALYDAIFAEMVNTYYESKEKFSNIPKDEMSKSLEKITDTVNIAKLTKYDKIKLQQNKTKTEEEEGYIYFSLVDCLQDDDFIKKYDKLSQEYSDKKTISETKYERRERLRKEKREERLVRKRGHALGIDRVVVFNPFYYKYDHRKKQSRKYIEAENSQIDLNDKILINSQKAGIDYALIDDIQLNEHEIQKFNDLAFLNTWLLERLKHVENDMEIINFDKEQVSDLISRYGTKHFCWMGIVNERNKKYLKGLYITMSLIYFPTLPFGIAYAVTPDWDTHFYSLVLDIESGEIKYARADKMDAKDADYVLNSSLYDLFYQLKSKRK